MSAPLSLTPEEVRCTVSDAVRRARGDMGLAALAERTRIKEPRLRGIDNGGKLPRGSEVWSLMRSLKLSADELLGWKRPNALGAMVPRSQICERLGRMLRQARKARKLSQVATADRLKTSTPTLAKIEQGVKFPRLDLFARIVEEFDIQADHVFRYPTQRAS